MCFNGRSIKQNNFNGRSITNSQNLEFNVNDGLGTLCTVLRFRGMMHGVVVKGRKNTVKWIFRKAKDDTEVEHDA